MNPLSWRRLLVLLNGALILGLLATGVHWFTSTRPSDAAARQPKGMVPTFEQLQRDAMRTRAAPVWPVDWTTIKEVMRPDDLMKPVEEGGPYVWPYVGPVPPPPSGLKPWLK